MTGAASAEPAAARREGRGATDPGDRLALAAAPAFAAMALLTGVLEGGTHSAGHGSPLDGMVLMYLLMAVFHTSPWLKLTSGRRDAVR